MRREPGKYSLSHYYYQVVSGSAGKGLVIVCHSDTSGNLTVNTKAQNIIYTSFPPLLWVFTRRWIQFAGNPAWSRPHFRDANTLATVLRYSIRNLIQISQKKKKNRQASPYNHYYFLFCFVCVYSLVRCGSPPWPSPAAAASEAAQYNSCVQVGSAQAEKQATEFYLWLFCATTGICFQSWPQLEKNIRKQNTRVFFATFSSVCSTLERNHQWHTSNVVKWMDHVSNWTNCFDILQVAFLPPLVVHPAHYLEPQRRSRTT